MSQKNIGMVLLFSGIGVMVLCVVIIILLFTGKAAPISLINIPAPTLNTGDLIPHVPGFPAPKGKNITIIPTKDFNNLLNLGLQFLLMTFIMSFGFKIADLGVKLLKPLSTK